MRSVRSSLLWFCLSSLSLSTSASDFARIVLSSQLSLQHFVVGQGLCAGDNLNLRSNPSDFTSVTCPTVVPPAFGTLEGEFESDTDSATFRVADNHINIGANPSVVTDTKCRFIKFLVTGPGFVEARLSVQGQADIVKSFPLRFGPSPRLGANPTLIQRVEASVVNEPMLTGTALLATSGEYYLEYKHETWNGSSAIDLTLEFNSVIPVTIDIKPQGGSINTQSNGYTRLAILSASDEGGNVVFNALEVNPESVEINGHDDVIKTVGKSAWTLEKDVDQDGLVDLEIQVATSVLADTVTLTGQTYQGLPIRGQTHP